MTLKQMLAAKAAAADAETGDHPLGPDAPKPPSSPVMAAAGAGYLGRQDGTEPLPERWPPDEASHATGSDLMVVQNPDGESYLAIRRPNGYMPIYLMGPLPTMIIPF